MSHLKKMFDPETVAVIGATEERGAVGRTVLENLLRKKDRKIFPISPHADEILGLKSFASISNVPEQVMLAVVATPAQSVLGAMEECGQAGVAGAMIVSPGFEESGEAGRPLRDELARIRKKYGFRILGPNSLGFVRPALGLNATCLRHSPLPGNIAFISQGGAPGDAILSWAVRAKFGFSMFASLGEMADIDFGDMIDFLGEDEATRSILIYMAEVGDARRFMSAARAFARHKPIIVLKPGRFLASAAPARSRSGSMAGDDSVYEAAFRRAGVVRVGEVAEFFNAARVLDSKRLPAGPRLAVVTSSGGLGVMATDALIHLGGKLAELSEDTFKRLNALLPPSWSKANPVDVLGDATAERFEKALSLCLSDRAVDAVLVIYALMDSDSCTQLARAVVSGARGAGKPVIAAWMGAEDSDDGKRILQENSIPTYATPEEAVRTYVNMCRYKSHLDQLYETPGALPSHEAPLRDYVRDLVRVARREGRTLLGAEESLEILKAYRIPVETAADARTPAEDRAAKIDVELILGAKKHPAFGSVILFGMGGKLAEFIMDFSIGFPPLNRTLAKVLMQDTKAYKMLQSIPGDATAAVGALEEILVSFSNLIVDFPEIAEIDVDPLAISNGNACARGARIVLDEHFDISDRSPYPHMIITPYPIQYTTPWQLSDGTQVVLRAIRPEDEPAEHEMLESLSQETLRTRFFSTVRSIPHEWLILFCNIDYDRQIAMIAEADQSDKKRIIGVGRLIMNDDLTFGDLAVLVHDKYQGRGLGTKFVELLVDIAREKGLEDVRADVLTDNRRMMNVFNRLGFSSQWFPGGTSKVILRLRG